MSGKTTHMELETSLTELRLPAFKSNFKHVAHEAEKESLTYEQYLHELVLKEKESRFQKRTEKSLRESRLPLQKNFLSFDLKRLPMNLRRQVDALKQGLFLRQKENVLAFGSPGSGKTHLLCALSRHLIEDGYRVYFTSCEMLLEDLLEAKQALKLSKFIQRLRKFDIVFIDDIGYIHKTREEMEVLFTFLSERYEKGSIMLTSNLPFSRWPDIFKDKMIAAAAIDRLIHHSTILEINLDSYRMAEAKKKRGKIKEG